MCRLKQEQCVNHLDAAYTELTEPVSGPVILSWSSEAVRLVSYDASSQDLQGQQRLSYQSQSNPNVKWVLRWETDYAVNPMEKTPFDLMKEEGIREINVTMNV